MSTRLTKAALLYRIRVLEKEIEGILSFHLLPVKYLASYRQYKKLVNTPDMILVSQYGKRFCIHEGEVGLSGGRRYCIKRS